MYVKKINYYVFIIHQVNKHGVSRRWYTDADVKDFKRGALRTTTNITRTGFELSVLQSRNTIYFSIIVIPEKSHFTIFAIEKLKKTREFHLYCQANAWSLVDCFHREIRVSTQIMVRD